MNDKLKYRIWDKNRNKMLIPQDNINYCCVGGYAVSIEVYESMDGSIRPVIRPTAIYDNAVSMQCTGLKDKNGKLIYEGDVVKFKPEVFGRPKQIIWDECHYILKDTLIILCNMEIEKFGLEVIGNVYENPELLSY